MVALFSGWDSLLSLGCCFVVSLPHRALGLLFLHASRVMRLRLVSLASAFDRLLLYIILGLRFPSTTVEFALASRYAFVDGICLQPLSVPWDFAGSSVPPGYLSSLTASVSLSCHLFL